MSIRDFYNETIKSKKKSLELNQLYKKPVPETRKQMPTTQVFAKNIYHQADTLYMPEDDNFKYVLVICDLYDGTIDAEPLKNRDTKTIENAFAKIYSRKYLDFPDFITVDQGSEFKKDIQVWFNKNGTYVKFAPTGRSRMLASVERANQKIATVLFKRMASEELLTGEPSKKWVKDLPELIEVFNENKKNPLNIDKIYPDPIVADEYSGKLLEIGQRVRIQLDYPINTTNEKRLIGKFRSSDIRWTTQIYKITEVLLKPNQVPMYLTDRPGYETVAYTKNQLQPVIKKLTVPDPKFIRNENPEYGIVDKILDKRIENRKKEYLVKWRGFPEDQATWINVKELNRTKDLKKMKKKYDEEND